MSINDFVEMTIFLWLICFSIYAKMQGFTVLFFALSFSLVFFFFFFFVCVCFTQKFKMAAKNGRKRIFEKGQQ